MGAEDELLATLLEEETTGGSEELIADDISLEELSTTGAELDETSLEELIIGIALDELTTTSLDTLAADDDEGVSVATQADIPTEADAIKATRQCRDMTFFNIELDIFYPRDANLSRIRYCSTHSLGAKKSSAF